MHEDKLKPCPFCGGEHVRVACYDVDGVSKYAAECSNLGPVCAVKTDYYPNAISAVEAWNKRTPTNNLKPCPLCGGNAKMKFYDNNGATMYYVECSRCHCHTFSSCEPQDIADIWNRRADER